MPEDQIVTEKILGLVIEVFGEDPGLASQLTYDVLWDFPEGPKRIICAPGIERWPSPLKVRALRLNKPVEGARVNGIFYMTSREIPDFGACAAQANAPRAPGSVPNA